MALRMHNAADDDALDRLHVLLPTVLEERSVQPDSAAGCAVSRWLAQDIAENGFPDWESRLEAAVDNALSVYQAFHATFCTFFFADGGRGMRVVRRTVQDHFGSATEPLVDGVLERILDGFDHLVDSFRRKYQPSLFKPLSVKSEKIAGYMVNVARTETKKLNLSDPLYHVTGQVHLASLSGKDSAPYRRDWFEIELDAQATLLARFWEGNGFTDRQRWEGLTGLLLGHLTGVPELADRCDAFRAEQGVLRGPILKRLDRRISRVVADRQQLEVELRTADRPDVRGGLEAELEEKTARLVRLRLARDRAVQKMLPKAADIQRLLESFVTNSDMARFSRISREIALFEKRLAKGREDLAQCRHRAAEEVARLADAVATQVLERPKGRSESAAGVLQRVAWLRKVKELLDRTRAVTGAVLKNPSLTADVRITLVRILADIEVLCDCGLIRRRGVTGVLGLLCGWRLEHVLRSGIEVLP